MQLEVKDYFTSGFRICKEKGQKMKNKKYKRNRRKKNKFKSWMIAIMIMIALIILVVWGRGYLEDKLQVQNLGKTKSPQWIDKQIIEKNGVSRNGKKLDCVKDIVIHYVGNPGSTAQGNHDFYVSPQSNVSSHFVVGLKGEIIQCIPLNEMSAASNWRNNDTISIEVCHPDDSGKFNKKTYQSLVKLAAWLLERCDLNEKHIIRHYDITGKECPRYYVRHEDKWEEFKDDVKKYREK